LIGFVVPTVVIGFGYVIPRSPIAGWNESTIGFAGSIAGACLTYVTGIALVLKDSKAPRA
jgi:ABC-type Fe3+ transport system permease subunit